MEVDLGGAHGLVAEDLLDGVERGARFEEVSCVAVAQGVIVASLSTRASARAARKVFCRVVSRWWVTPP